MTAEELVALNNQLAPRYRASVEELRDILDIDERYQRAEYLRGRMRYLSTLRRFKKKPSVSTLREVFPTITEWSVRRAVETSGAWGTSRRLPIDDEDLAFAAVACRPAKYAQEVEAIKAEGYEPPLLPPDHWERYMLCREYHKKGLLWSENNPGHRDIYTGTWV